MVGLGEVSYAVREVSAHWNDREWWRNRSLQRINGPVQRRVTGDAGIEVMDEDWDTLLVFDACRADLFEEHWDTGSFSTYRRVTSKGSWTVEWATRNFTEQYGDTVYVTANPLISRHHPERWHELVEVWRDGFDEGIQSVPPEAVTEAAIRAHETHPDKRVVVHYVQPHVPFIEDERLRFGGGWSELDEWEGEHHASVANVWEALREGLVSHEETERGYAENLRVLEPAVDDLLDAIEGKVVVTSDHGNVFGERTWPVPLRVYGHPPNQRLPGLVEVPWGERTLGERRNIVAGDADSTSEGDGGVESRLRALGYRS